MKILKAVNSQELSADEVSIKQKMGLYNACDKVSQGFLTTSNLLLSRFLDEKAFIRKISPRITKSRSNLKKSIALLLISLLLFSIAIGRLRCYCGFCGGAEQEKVKEAPLGIKVWKLARCSYYNNNI